MPGHTVGISPFVEPLIATLGISRVHWSNIFFTATLLSTLMLPLFGGLFDRIGSRRAATYCGISLGLTLLFLGNMNSIITYSCQFVSPVIATTGTLFVGFFLLKLLGQNLVPLVSRMMVLHWYDNKSCRMVGLSGILVSVIFGPTPRLTQMLITQFGYSHAWKIWGAAVLCLFAPIIWATCRDTPQSIGMELDAKPQQNIPDHRTAPKDKTRRQALASVDFWIFTLATAISIVTTTGIHIHIVDIFRETHSCSSDTMGIFIPMAIVSATGSFLFGAIFDRISIYYCLLAIFAANALTMESLEYVSLWWGLYLFIFFSGINLALYGIIFSVPWPKLFGRKHLGQIMSAVAFIVLIFGAIAPSIFAYARAFGSYLFATRSLLALSGLGFLISLCIHGKKLYRRE
ncbi:MAG: MFS transporter [Puniceicoccales bacterium]|nr:MFS transporter [Puniceicoccales bacterium]